VENVREIDVPVIGIVLQNGYVESYDYKMAAANDFHHSFIMASKTLGDYNYDDTLRFVKLPGENYYTLEGEPALEPYTTGKNQICAFAVHCISKGIDPNTRIKIKDHKLDTTYEGAFIGSLKKFIR
jgi:hypothetical protein